MNSNLTIRDVSDVGSSLYDGRMINSLPDHLRLRYILSLNGLQTFVLHDRISILPDDLLRHILGSLPTRDAIRTSVLSRRWRRVWIGLPTMAFSDDGTQSAAGFTNSVDEALAHNHDIGMDTLEISVRHPPHMARANEWLQRAAERVRQKITITFHHHDGESIPVIVLDLPYYGAKTTAMALRFRQIGVGALLILPPASAAVPSSLTQLELKNLRIDGSSLSNFVSSCCPHLRKLIVHTFGDVDALRLSNDALEDLDLDFHYGGLRRLEVSSRSLCRLRIIEIFAPEVMAHEDGGIAASFRTPRLEDLSWSCSLSVHPSRVEFAHSLATVSQLYVGLATHALVNYTRLYYNKLALWLLHSCTRVSRLKVSLHSLLPDPISMFGVLDETTLAHYEDLMVEVPQLSTVTDLTVCTILNHHAHGASIATLLSRSCHIETLTIIVRDEMIEHRYACARTAACWCKRPANWREEKLCLEYLRQVDLKGFIMADWLPDLVSLLRYSRPPVLITAHDIHEQYELSDASTLQILQQQKEGYIFA